MPKEKPALNAGFLIAYPPGPNLIDSILKVLLNHDEAYAPDSAELGRADNYKVMPFEQHMTTGLSQKWDNTPPPEIWHLRREKPAGLLVTLSKSSLTFEPFLIQVDREFLGQSKRIGEFLEVVEEFYNVLHPAHGDIHLIEMRRLYDSPFSRAKMGLGINLKRALPDLYWANFLGPEYVSMFGLDRLLSTPCHSKEELSDGGVLLILSSSPIDYLGDPVGFDLLRQKAKEHLGVEAFDTGDPNYKGKTPEFRFIDEREKVVTPLNRPRTGSNKFLRQTRREWNDWIEKNEDLAFAFIRDMKSRGVELDLSPRGLRTLDWYIRNLRAADVKPADDFLKTMAAYVSQVVIRETGASWSFMAEDVPELSLGDIYFSPLARTEKAIGEGETFEHWYRFLVEELMPKVKTERSS